MVQARLAGRISDCLRGVPQGDCWGVLLWSPWSDPGSEGVEQVGNLDQHISHNFGNKWHATIFGSSATTWWASGNDSYVALVV